MLKLFLGALVVAFLGAFLVKTKTGKKTEGKIVTTGEEVNKTVVTKAPVQTEALQNFMATYLDYTKEFLFEYLENISQVIAFKKDNKKLSLEVLQKMPGDNDLELLCLKPVTSIVFTSFVSPNKLVVEVHYDKVVHELHLTALQHDFYVDRYVVIKK